MDAPSSLTGEALAFWQRNAPRLEKDGRLTADDVDTFMMLCQTWGDFQSMAGVGTGEEFYREQIQKSRLRKEFIAIARQFGLLPAERKRMKLTGDPDESDEFGL